MFAGYIAHVGNVSVGCWVWLFTRMSGDEYFRALRCEGFDRGRANAVVGAADQDDFVFELGVNHLSGYFAYLISISNSINQEIPY
jgi:hypothetical protein